MSKLFVALGGRKASYGLLAALLLTAMAFPLDASFEAYSMSLLGALGLTSAGIVVEDSLKRRA